MTSSAIIATPMPWMRSRGAGAESTVALLETALVDLQVPFPEPRRDR